MDLCRNCVHWQETSRWKGNCRKHPWGRDKYSQSATANGCRDYVDRQAKYQLASTKEA